MTSQISSMPTTSLKQLWNEIINYDIDLNWNGGDIFQTLFKGIGILGMLVGTICVPIIIVSLIGDSNTKLNKLPLKIVFAGIGLIVVAVLDIVFYSTMVWIWFAIMLFFFVFLVIARLFFE